MATLPIDFRAPNWPALPAARGYQLLYREHDTNYCPGCGRSHWLVGRLLAECAFCATALPLESASVAGNQFRRRGRSDLTPLAA